MNKDSDLSPSNIFSEDFLNSEDELSNDEIDETLLPEDHNFFLDQFEKINQITPKLK